MGGEPRDAKRRLVIEEDESIDGEDDTFDDDDGARDTVRPAFDVERYAEDMAGRERLPTITDEAAIEEARIASVLMDSTPPKSPFGRPSEVEIGVRYAEVDAFGEDEQLAFFRARLAPMTRIPELTRKLTELGPVIEDPKTAYVLGFVDGLLPLETIVEVAGLPELDTLRVLDRAVEQYLVTFRDRARPRPR
ncbi:MAG TPA: hypothetical protein VM580_15260 [Labilithrix sp.]|jgi:hypothetical protein|nr:hypothetical protein [Labilithrix sp.]